MSLHNEIMNILCDENHLNDYPELRLHYKLGHKDARHAAAELAIKADAEIKRLIEALTGIDAVVDKMAGLRGYTDGIDKIRSLIDQATTPPELTQDYLK